MSRRPSRARPRPAGPVDVARLMEEIKERVRERRASGFYSEDEVRRIAQMELELTESAPTFQDELEQHLAHLNDGWDTAAEPVITSHRAGRGRRSSSAASGSCAASPGRTSRWSSRGRSSSTARCSSCSTPSCSRSGTSSATPHPPARGPVARPPRAADGRARRAAAQGIASWRSGSAPSPRASRTSGPSSSACAGAPRPSSSRPPPAVPPGLGALPAAAYVQLRGPPPRHPRGDPAPPARLPRPVRRRGPVARRRLRPRRVPGAVPRGRHRGARHRHRRRRWWRGAGRPASPPSRPTPSPTSTRLPDDTLGGIFCAQVIEHLPPEALVALVRLAHRKLRPGGVLLCETPEPGLPDRLLRRVLRRPHAHQAHPPRGGALRPRGRRLPRRRAPVRQPGSARRQAPAPRALLVHAPLRRGLPPARSTTTSSG